MKILVPVKRVVDYYIKVRVKSDNSGVALENIKMAINPFDEISLEEAVRLRDKGVASEVVAVSCGVTACQEVLRTALAAGADRAILIETSPEQELQPLGVAKLLQALIAQEKPELVICGKQAIDDDANQTGQMLAALMGWSQATFASEVSIENGVLKAVREIDGGRETLEMALPAVITSDLRLNEPRHLTLMNIMKAKKKPIETIAVADLNADIAPRLRHVNYSEPSDRQGGIKLASVEDLIARVKSDARVN